MRSFGGVDLWTRFTDVVWSEAKQIGIIDSVFRNFYIPPIIFAVNTFEDGSENKTCIDGKQRLTSIHRYGFHFRIIQLFIKALASQIYGWLGEFTFYHGNASVHTIFQIPRK